jgi:WD40 repeat protein
MRHAVWIGVVAVFVTGGSVNAQNKKPNVQAKLEGHRGGVSALAFNPKVSVIATGSGNGVVKLWEAKTGELITRMDAQKPTGARVNQLGFSADGTLLSASSRNAVVVWNIVPPKVDPKVDPKIDPKTAIPVVPGKEPFVERGFPVVFEDGQGTDPAKIGIVTGDGKRAYFSASEGVRTSVSSRVFGSRFGTDTSDDLKTSFTPWAITAITDADSALVAMYGSVKNADKTEQPAVAFVGLGDARIVGRGVVRPQVVGRPTSIGFAPDRKWLVACNGEDLMYWRVPGSQVVEGDPKLLLNSSAFAAAAGPNGLIAFASVPEEGKKVKVTITDVSGAQPKVVGVYATDMSRVSSLAFSPDGLLLAVGNDLEGVVELWNLGKK